MDRNQNVPENPSHKIYLTKKELQEMIIQYKIMRELLETCPKRKILVNKEKDWHYKKEQFFQKHPKIEKLYKINLQ